MPQSVRQPPRGGRRAECGNRDACVVVRMDSGPDLVSEQLVVRAFCVGRRVAVDVRSAGIAICAAMQ
eukprot:11214144-Lingulodinium_polyedra.AAC.1